MSDLDRSAPPWRDPVSYEPAVATSAKAVASLVLGIVGLFVPLVCSLIALYLGYRARRQIGSTSGLAGRGVATAGIALGWIGVALFALLLLLGGDLEWHVSFSGVG